MGADTSKPYGAELDSTKGKKLKTMETPADKLRKRRGNSKHTQKTYNNLAPRQNSNTQTQLQWPFCGKQYVIPESLLIHLQLKESKGNYGIRASAHYAQKNNAIKNMGIFNTKTRQRANRYNNKICSLRKIGRLRINRNE